MQVGNGRHTSFWGDVWCDQCQLKDMFPDIYDICIEQSFKVAEAAEMNWSFSFGRWMTPDVALQMHGLSENVAQTMLNNEPDKPF
jgi:hypothetical protein